MKLATLADGSRDGRLAVVSSDLSRAVFATSVAPTLQAALDNWAVAAPDLEGLARALEAGRTGTFAMVNFPGSEALVGSTVRVRVDRGFTHSCRGEAVP